MAMVGLLAGTLSYMTLNVGAEPEPVVPPATTVIYGGTAGQRAMVERAMELMERAQLPLPELRVFIHADREGCGGYNGRFHFKDDPFRVDICLADIRVALHELAHAWEHHTLDDATRLAFMEFAESLSWNKWAHSHNFRGIEQSACAIEWGVREEPLQALALIYDARKLEAYELLTGMPSPRIAHLPAEGEAASENREPPGPELANSGLSVEGNVR